MDLQASLRLRMFGFVIDLALISAFYMPTSLALGPSFSSISLLLVLRSLANFTSVDLAMLGLSYVIASAIALVYWSGSEFLFGTSVGKFVVHLRVCSVSEERLSLGQALVRSIGKLLPVLNVADAVYLIFSTNSRRLFDRLADTQVTLRLPNSTDRSGKADEHPYSRKVF